MTSLDMRLLGRTGLRLTTLGFGGGPIGWRNTPEVDDEAQSLLQAAWQGGIRYFDTAPYYGFGDSERRIGRYLAHRPRDAFVLSSKVGRLMRPRDATDRSAERVVYDYSYDGAMRSLEDSLGRLGLARIDIALIHDIDRWTHGDDQPVRFREAVDGAYRALADLKAQGVIGAIGLGVNEWEVCDAFAKAVPTDCFLLAGRHTLLQHEAQATFLPYCAEQAIGLIIGGPYNSGILASGAVPGALYDYAPATAAILARVRRIEAVCADFGVALPAAALAFPLRDAVVATVIPGVATKAELDATLSYATTEVPEALWAALIDNDLLEATALA
jgi:D-threo-aldose 1-dehydrogenase